MLNKKIKQVVLGVVLVSSLTGCQEFADFAGDVTSGFFCLILDCDAS